MQVGQRKNLRQALCFTSLLLLLWACQKPPEFPIVPEITYQKITKQVGYNLLGEKIDSVVISIEFKDGDGDLGSDDADAPDNYYCSVLIQKGDEFVPLIKPDTALPLNKDGRFFSLKPDGKLGPIEGTLNYGPELYDVRGDIVNNDSLFTLKFKVSIKDNAGHTSNEVETDPVDIQIYR